MKMTKRLKRIGKNRLVGGWSNARSCWNLTRSLMIGLRTLPKGMAMKRSLANYPTMRLSMQMSSGKMRVRRSRFGFLLDMIISRSCEIGFLRVTHSTFRLVSLSSFRRDACRGETMAMENQSNGMERIHLKSRMWWSFGRDTTGTLTAMTSPSACQKQSGMSFCKHMWKWGL